MAMKSNISFTAAALAVLLSGSAFAQSAKQALVVKANDEDVVTALPILDNTVITFHGETVTIRKEGWSRSFAKSDISNFDLLDHFHSDFNVSIVSKVDEISDLSDISVTLTDEYNGDLEVFTLETDGSGSVSFSDIPTGFYTVCVTDKRDRFIPIFSYGVHHGFNESLTLAITKEHASVDSVDSDVSNDVYYDLQGRPVKNPSSGIFLHINGSRSEKVIIK